MTPTPKIPLEKIKAIATYRLKIIIVAVIYYLADRLGLKMAYVKVNTTPASCTRRVRMPRNPS
jgi:phosphate-selective porin